MNTSNQSQTKKPQALIKLGLLLLSSCLILTACKGEDKKTTDTGAKLISPRNATALSIEGEQLQLTYRGVAEKSNVRISLNGVQCGDVTAPLTTGCNLTHAGFYGLAYGNLKDLASVLVLGDNTVVVENTTNNYQKTLHFYFNDQKPELKVTCSDAPTSPAPCNAGGEIHGRIVSAAALISQLNFVVSGNTQTSQLGCVDATDTSAELTTFVPYTSFISEAMPFNCEAGKDKAFIVSNITAWPTASNVPAYQYQITDEYKQTAQEKFVLPGAQINNSQALQINNTFLQHLAPLMNSYLKNINSFLSLVQGGTDVKQELINGINSKLSQAISSQQAGDPLWEFAKTLCSAADVGSVSNCNVQVKSLDIKKPNFKIGGRGETKYYVNTALNIDRFSVRIYAGDNASSASATKRIEGTLVMDDFSFYTNLSPVISASNSGTVMEIARTPFKFDVGEGWFNIPLVELHNVSCLPKSLCETKVLFFTIDAEAGLNIYKIFNKDGLNVQLAKLGSAMEALANSAIGAGPYPVAQVADSKKQLASVLNRQAHMVDKAPRDILLRFNGGFANSGVPSISTFLGVPYTGLNSAKAASAGFLNKIPDVDFVDVNYALSVDAVNQRLAVDYQAGKWTNDQIKLLIDDAADTTNPQKCLVVNANGAPQVKFYAHEKQSVSVGGGIGGQYVDENGQVQTDPLFGFDTTKKELPGSIKLALKDADVSVYPGDCTSLAGTPLIDHANLSVALRVSIYAKDNSAYVVPFEDYPDSFRKLNSDAPVVVHALGTASVEDAAKVGQLLTLKLNEMFGRDSVAHPDTFNQKLQEDRHIQDISWIQSHQADLTCSTFPQIPASLCSQLPSLGVDTIGGALAFLTTNINGPMFIQYGVKVQALTIDNTGNYLKFLARIHSKDVSSAGACSATPEYFRSYCVQW